MVRGVVQNIVLDSFIDDSCSADSEGLNHRDCEVQQSRDIAGGVHVSKDDVDVDAAAQIIMFGCVSEQFGLCHSSHTADGNSFEEELENPDGKTYSFVEFA